MFFVGFCVLRVPSPLQNRTMSIQFATGVVEAKRAGSDETVCWLSLRHVSGVRITRIFDYQRISANLVVERSYELLLVLSYPDCVAGNVVETWLGTVASLRYPRPNGNITSREFPLEPAVRRVWFSPSKKRKKNPTGPLCPLVQTLFGYVIATMSVLQQYHACRWRVGSTFVFACDQRLDLLAVL